MSDQFYRICHAVLTLVAISLTTSAFSQDVYLGVKAGLNIGSEHAGDSYNRVGYHFGIFTAKQYQRSAVQLELIASNFKLGYSYPVYGDRHNSYWYVNVPAVYKRYVGGKGFNAQAGLQFGVLVNATGVQSYNPTGATPPVMGDISLPTTLLGSAIFGAGWDSPFGLTIDLRYTLGLTDSHTEYASWTVRNRGMQLSFGYRIKRKN